MICRFKRREYILAGDVKNKRYTLFTKILCVCVCDISIKNIDSICLMTRI